MGRKGCGNSSLSEDMYRDGFHNITNVDYSAIVIENMKNRSAETRSMQWLVMDIKDLKFECGSFDVVMEKATLDALLVGEKDPWRLSDESRTLIDDILLQVGFLFLKTTSLLLFIEITVLLTGCRIGVRRVGGQWPFYFHHFRPASFP